MAGDPGAHRPRDGQGRFARIVEHMRGVKIMEARSTLAAAGDDELADDPAAPVDGYGRTSSS